PHSNHCLIHFLLWLRGSLKHWERNTSPHLLSSNLPVSASQVAGIIGVHHCARQVSRPQREDEQLLPEQPNLFAQKVNHLQRQCAKPESH
uniref:Uncharacterized protein n=1 Tax=Chrysemys picta bellii TaxID=8478 RepID=A0A8C3I9D9_CHRPI